MLWMKWPVWAMISKKRLLVLVQMIRAKRTRTPPPPKRAQTGSLQDMYQEILAENDVNKQATTSETASQLYAYLGEATILKKTCPLKYWSSAQVRFPALARVARKYLSAPCTSVDSQRLLSAISNIIDEKRNRIHCDNAEMLIFIQKNLPLTYMDKGKKLDQSYRRVSISLAL
ncbi:uncharacterized protein LOC115413708 isoform X2 [Sphaeramia orbicularis]|uniref:uncharacterized protein LOC115413708 isoform X2 n=1 Tax=Sphaeramia orbicularis TaxID=375764 RepID=UPI0011802081|nr:uncharacterized protein LOC115413708 isoform X2 [Sphaeramia orbicularis]